MKRLIAITTTAILFTAFVSVGSAQAGAARRHTIEGFMLGSGVALLGAAIINEMNKDSRPAPDSYSYNRHRPPVVEDSYHRHNHRAYQNGRHFKRYAQNQRGHWEVEKVWVEPVYEKKWNPAHYNKRGVWVSGRYEKFVVQEGYWSQNKVWVWH